MDFDNIKSKEKQDEIRHYYDKKLKMKKRPYHFFASKYRKQYEKKYKDEMANDISKRLTKAWKKLTWDEYLVYLRIALDEVQTVLTNKGYELYKPIYPESELEKIRKDLTVKPRVAKGYGKAPEAYSIYTETKTKLIIPRYYGWSKLPNAKSIPNKISKGKKINVSFKGELRDYQKPVIEKFRYLFDTVGGGLLQAGCGLGKTTQALYMVYMLQRKTLVLLHKENLLLQWKERIQQFLPDARIGIIQAQTVDVDDKDIVIGMIQSICKKDYGDLFQEFGLVISDEAHRTGAKEFCKALKNAATYYTLGLTATPNRSDGLTKVFKWYLGDTGFVLKREKTYDVTVKIMYYQSDFYEEKKLYSGGYNYANMIGQIVNEKKRNMKIVKMARKMVLEDERQVLIIGHRINLLKMLEKLIKGANTTKENVTVGFFIGGMKEADLNQTTKCNVILGSYSMIEEGADIPTLDTVIMATPKSNVEQTVGRIMRQQNKNDPLIVDIIDEFSAFPRQAEKRKAFYKKQKYKLVGYRKKVDDKEVEVSECVF